MKRKRKLLESLNNLDPIDMAEKITGVPGSEETGSLGLGLFLKKNKIKKDLLSEAGDSYFGIPYEDYCLILESFGFSKVYSHSFKDEVYGKIKERRENVFWNNSLNALVISDEYSNLNSATMYFELSLEDISSLRKENLSMSSSPSCKEHVSEFCQCPDSNIVISASIDVREGIFLTLQKIKESGVKFNKDWAINKVYSFKEGDSPSESFKGLPENLKKQLGTPSIFKI